MTKAQPLAGLRIVDFSGLRTGAQVSQFLADFGADVIQVEPPGGSPLRDAAAWPFWGRGKRAVRLDLKTADDLAVAQRLAADADVVIETFRPGRAATFGLDYETLAARNPGLVHASITGFGGKGPLADLQGYEGVVQAKLGVFWSLADMADRPGPAFASAAYASYPASQLALQGIMAALYEREASGLGQKVETSLAQALTVHDIYQWFSRVVASRYSDGFVQAPRVVDGVPSGGLSFRVLVALTADGRWLQFSQLADRLFAAMMKLFELDWMFKDPQWCTLPDFDGIDQRRAFWEQLLAIVRSKTAAEWEAAFQAHPDVWGERYREGADLLRHPQMLWNGMVAEINDPERGPVNQPGPLVRAWLTPAALNRSAPRLGEYDDAIRREAAAPAAAQRATQSAPVAMVRPPLDGVTIVELGTYFAAPFGATLLAELGARVIKIEQPDGDPHRSMLPFPEVAAIKVLQGKECVAVDLGAPEGQAIAHRLISSADAVLQSFRGGVAKRLNVDEATLRGLNPDLIYLAAPGYGEDGPYARRPAFAPTIGAAAGLAWRNAGPAVMGRSDLSMDEVKAAALRLATAVSGVGNSDALSAVSVATALMFGLLARKRGAGGQKLSTTMLSSTAHALSEVMVEWKGQPAEHSADPGLHGFNALYRLYETAEEWVFLAAPKDREWPRLLSALGQPGAALAADMRFATPEGRRSADADLSEALADIFRCLPARDWELTMRAHDVACVVAERGPVEANYMDEGSTGRLLGLVTTGRHPILDEVPRLKPLVEFSRSVTVAGDAALVGQHTDHVLRGFGYGDDELARLAEAGVILRG